MLVTGKLLKPLKEARYLNVENTDRYRPVLRLFYMNYEKLKYWMYIEEVYEVEKNINFLNHAITNYLVKINQATLPIEDLKSIGALFHVVNDIERIGDHAENVADSAKQRISTGVGFSKEAQRGLGEMVDMVNTLIQFAVEMFSSGTEEHLEDIMHLEDAVDEKERELQKEHVGRLTRNECSPEAGMLFSDIVSGLERVADHATNIAFSILNADPEEE